MGRLHGLALEFRPHHPVASRHQDEGGVRELQRICRVNGQFHLRRDHLAVPLRALNSAGSTTEKQNGKEMLLTF